MDTYNETIRPQFSGNPVPPKSESEPIQSWENEGGAVIPTDPLPNISVEDEPQKVQTEILVKQRRFAKRQHSDSCVREEE